MIKKYTSVFAGLRRITSGQAFIPEIDFLRFIAIMAVVSFHINSFILIKKGETEIFGNFLNGLIKNGAFGVELFFVISGFILSIPFASFYFEKKSKGPSLKKFYFRRITRLEPPYIILMTLLFLSMLVLRHGESLFYLKSWSASLIYMHNIFFRHMSYLNAVTWSLEIEVFFYLSFPVLAKLFSLSIVWRRLTLLTLMITVPTLSKVYIHANFSNILDYLQFFIAGMLLCDFYLNDHKLIVNKYVAFTLLIGLIYIIFKVNWRMNMYYFIFIFPTLLALFCLLVLSNGPKIPLFRNKILVIIGGMCYSIYLLHYPVISLVGNFVVGKNNQFNSVVLTLALFISVLLISTVYFKLVERPFMGITFMDKFFKSKKVLSNAN